MATGRFSTVGCRYRRRNGLTFNQMECFLNSCGPISHIHLGKSPQVLFIKERQNLQGDRVNHLSHSSGPIGFVAASLAGTQQLKCEGQC